MFITFVTIDLLDVGNPQWAKGSDRTWKEKSAVLFPSLGRTFKNYDRREIRKVYRFVVGQTDITSTMERLKTDTPSEMY